MRLSGKGKSGRSNSLGQIPKRVSPSRSAPGTPDGASLVASAEMYNSSAGNVKISKRLVVTDAIDVDELCDRRRFLVWGPEGDDELEIWREQEAPKDSSLFVSLSTSSFDVVDMNAARPDPRLVAKSICRKIIRESWLPDITWAKGSEFPPYPHDLIPDPLCIEDLLKAVKEVLAKESHVVSVDAPCRVFGDIHGQLLDLMQFFAHFGHPDPITGDVSHVSYVFLGDFCDRGFFSLEVLLLLFSLKLLQPDRVILVRGNHESRGLSSGYGFLQELLSKLGPAQAPRFFELFNDVFDHLPLTCLIGKKILCMHGGLGPNIHTMSDIANVPKPLRSDLKMELDQTWTNLVARDLLWSDPANSCDKGFTTHPVRGSGVFRVGSDKVMEFLEQNKLQLIVRGHECVSLGFAFNCSGRIMTVFSAINYCGDSRNAGACLEITRDLMCIPKVIRHTEDPARDQLKVHGENRLRESIHGDVDSLMDSDEFLGPRPVVALYDFEAEKPLELTLRKGDIVTILNDENPEWLWVENQQKKQGYCPRAFLGRA